MFNLKILLGMGLSGVQGKDVSGREVKGIEVLEG